VLCAHGACSRSSYALAETTSRIPRARWLRHTQSMSSCALATTSSLVPRTLPAPPGALCIRMPAAALCTPWLRRQQHLLVLAGCDMTIMSSCALAATASTVRRAFPAPPRALCTWRQQQVIVRPWLRRHQHFLQLACSEMLIMSSCPLAATASTLPRALPAPPGALCIRVPAAALRTPWLRRHQH